MESGQTIDWSGRRVDDADFSAGRLHSPNFEGTRITDGWLRNADISADIEGLRINGVEVAPLVEAELDRLQPERVLLRATDPSGLARAWTLIERKWQATVDRAEALAEPLLHEQVDGEWSFVETLRHLIMATDCHCSRMIRQEPYPYHPWGLAGSFLTDPASLGLDYDADPNLDQVLVVRRQRMDTVARTIAALTPSDLERECVPPDTPGHPTSPRPLLQCVHVILDEEWMHCGYANRDLDILTAP